MFRDELSCRQYHDGVFEELKHGDAEVYDLIMREYSRLRNTLQLIAAENQCSRAVLAALGSIVQNKTTEGFPRARFHGGSEVVDDIEELANARAREAFNAKYANVQPHSGSQANQIVLTALLQKGDKILSLAMDQGGHVSHGAKLSFGGKYFEVASYGVDSRTFLLDYEAIRRQAIEFRPKLIICGASAYARAIDFEKFRAIADEAGAYLLADISHISGLVIAGAHQSPVNHAHFTTTSTYKPGGPRGGIIIMGRDFDRTIEVGSKSVPLWKCIEKMTFPGVQGTPNLNNIAAKAVFFKETLSKEYVSRQYRIIQNARRLAENMVTLGWDVLTGGTDNHMILMNVGNSKKGLTGVIAQKSLEQCGIAINMNKLPHDMKPAAVTSGMRLGTPIVTRNGMRAEEMDEIAGLVDRVLRRVEIVSDTEYRLDGKLSEDVRGKIEDLCGRFPIDQSVSREELPVAFSGSM